ncbi:MAG: A/G-specific adenine glycosylase [Opitutales bacterium]
MSDVKSSSPPASLEALRAPLQEWFASAARPLPWRVERTLYRTVVSEFMCQQTQVATVLPYFARWMRAFPDFAALAAAPEEAVLTAWSGLGYYARARNLQRLARALTERDAPPRTVREWLELPGIGPYTAAAICSLHYEVPAAVVDGNVIRVLSRVAGLEEAFPNAAAAGKAVRPLAEAFLDPAAPGVHNEALMELGAMVCVKHRPACLLCPLKAGCRALATGVAGELPRIRRRASERRTVHRLWILEAGRIHLARARRGARRLAELAELPEWSMGEPPAAWHLLAKRRRGISHQLIEEHIWVPEDAATALEALAGDSRGEGGQDLFAHPVATLEEIAVSGPHRRWIRELTVESDDPA